MQTRSDLSTNSQTKAKEIKIKIHQLNINKFMKKSLEEKKKIETKKIEKKPKIKTDSNIQFAKPAEQKEKKK